MNYQEAPYTELPAKGLSADYVAREPRRAVAAAGGRVKIYPGIDIDVPKEDRQTDKAGRCEARCARGVRRRCRRRDPVPGIRGDVAGESLGRRRDIKGNL